MKKSDGPFVLRFNETDEYYSQWNGQYVATSWNNKEQSPATTNLRKAKIFHSVGGSAYSQVCDFVPINISIREG